MDVMCCRRRSCIPLRNACFGLFVANHPTVKDLAQKLFTSWLAQINDPGVGVDVKRSLLLGVCNIATASNSILQMENSSEIDKIVNQSDLISCLKEQSALPEMSLTSGCVWLLGQLYLSSTDANDNKTSVPSNYSYLDDTSVIKAIVHLLQEAGRLGPECTHVGHVALALRTLVQGTSQALPPLNWASLLSPLMRMSYGDDVKCLCLQMAVKQSQGSPSAAMLVTSWLLAPLHDSLSSTSKRYLFSALPTLIKTVPVTKLAKYLNHELLRLFREPVSEVNKDTCLSALWGLVAALKVNDPPASVTLLLYQTVESLYRLPAVLQCLDFAAIVCECLREEPDTVIDNVIADDFRSTADDDSDVTVSHGVFTRCYLIGCGNQPLTLLNYVIEAGLGLNTQCQSRVHLHLYQSLLSVCDSKTDGGVASAQSVWLLELMGHTKNVAQQVLAPPTARCEGDDVTAQLAQDLWFLIGAFNCAVVALSSSQHHVMMGVSGVTSHTQRLNATSVTSQSRSAAGPETEGDVFTQRVFEAAPEALYELLQAEPWKRITAKIIDWFLTLLNTTSVQAEPTLKSFLTDCLFQLRHSAEFNKISIWSKAFADTT